jgi:carbonic anhydrase/acetyltransferase-like protein (isoleucine patch superfamily)
MSDYITTQNSKHLNPETPTSPGIHKEVERGTIHSFDGKDPIIHPSCFLAYGSRVIGDVELEENVSVWFNAVIRGDVERVRIKRGTNIQDGAIIHVTHFKNPTLIGENVTVGHGAIIHGCTIGDRSLIGMNAVVLDRAVVGKECLIAAGSVVRGGMVIPDGTMVAGIPAKVVKQLSPEERAQVAEGADNYMMYVQHYRGGLEPKKWDVGTFAGK